jgi:predicted dehydrogenase
MPVRVGLIGYGFAGRTFHAPLIDATDEVTLAAIATSRADAVAAERPTTRVYTDGRGLLDDASLELIVVATPNDSHAQWARAALEAGKHVVVEKPFALELAEARALTRLAANRGRLLAVFHNRRWDSDFLTVQRAIAANRVGRIVHFESHMDRFRPAVRRRWREGDGPGAGIWYDLAPHLVDQALLLFGLPSRVTGLIARLRDGALADDWAHGILTYPDKRVIVHASMLAAGGVPRFVAHGTAGSFAKQDPDPQERQLLSGIRPGAPDWGRDPDPLVVWSGEGTVEREPARAGDQREFYRAIASAVRAGTANPTKPHEVLGVMAVIEAALRSSALGSSLPLALDADELAAWRDHSV